MEVTRGSARIRARRDEVVEVRAGRGMRAGTAAVLLALAAACTANPPAPTRPTTADGSAGAGSPSAGTGTRQLQVGGRAFTLHVPDSYDPAKPAPLLLLLHGYTASGAVQETYLKLTPESDRRGFLYAYPDGLADARNNRYWNATDACCDLFSSKVDDSAYLSSVITTIESTYRVDTKRVYLAGHSNGAFMSFRMACDHADQITAIATLNGAMWQDTDRCKPSGPVSVLDIRGTADETIAYAGGSILNHRYPSAATTDADWLGFDHCATKGTAGTPLDLIGNLPGAETSVQRYTGGCAGGSTVETWTIKDGTHVPPFGAAFAPAVMDFLLARSKP
jgi:polyhydroxybutyrate depolymerase